jgi:hypothetical protein
MKRTRLLLLLVLLMTAATGAWAQDAKHLITGTYFEKIRSLKQPLPYATTVGELYEAVTGEHFSDLISYMSLADMTLTGISSNNTSVVSIGEFNGASTPVTVKADGKAAVGLNFGGYVQGIFVSVTPPLYVTMKDGVKDADKWTAKVGEGQAQALPIGGLKGDGSETVTLQYNGRLKVKSVTAVSDEKPADNTYLKWDANQKKLVATEIPAEVKTAADANQDVFWEAGTYVVEGNVTISGQITLDGNVELIIKDGAKLTVTNQIASDDKNLSIYGQASQTGQLVVNSSDADAINNITTLEVHSAKVTASSSNNSCGGFYNIGTFNVYGGSVDAEGTSGEGYGIGLPENGSMNIYGGEVRAEGRGNGNSYSYGIRSGTSGATVTVYGGTLWAGCADKAALRNTITLTKGDGFSGKIETSSDGSSWTEYTSTGTPDAKYVRAGY